ncbi:MAG: carboxypeptidase-like regulatory domain-containing protein, partial [Endomicrobium sp.]|nr:carboxypeptidase-like regulatory domain-containing protein [Endomicrobium sp.]
MKKAFSIFLNCLFCATLFCVPQAGSQEKQHSVSGFVTTREGAGVSGVEIKISGTIQDTKYTDPTGRYSFDEIPSEAKIELLAKKDNYSITPSAFR